MSMRDASKKRTLCEVLREINDLHQKNNNHDKKVRLLLQEAEKMGKKMSLKLLDYNKEVFADWWVANPDHEKDLRRRIKKGYLV